MYLYKTSQSKYNINFDLINKYNGFNIFNREGSSEPWIENRLDWEAKKRFERENGINDDTYIIDLSENKWINVIIYVCRSKYKYQN